MKKKIKKVERVRGRVKADKNSHADKKTAKINKDEERALIFLPVADQDESLRMTVFSNLFGLCILTASCLQMNEWKCVILHTQLVILIC